MLKTLAIAGALLVSAPAWAANEGEGLAGLYDGGQIEIGTAILLGEDGRFEYFLTYGALDEVAQGSWQVQDGSIVLDSDPVVAPAFELQEADEGTEDSFEIELEVPDGLPVQLFSLAVLLSDGTTLLEDFRGSHMAFDFEPGVTASEYALALQPFDIVSDRFTVQPGAHSMRYRFMPNDFGEVDFDRQVLRRDGDAFVLERYDRTLRYRKVEE